MLVNGIQLGRYDNTQGQIVVAGAAAFTGVAQNTATPYRIAGLSGIDRNPPANAFPPNVAPYQIPVTLGGYTNAGTVLTVAGNVTQFNAKTIYQ